MFDSDAGPTAKLPADAGATLSAVELAHHELVAREAQILVLAAHWADLHAVEIVDGQGAIRTITDLRSARARLAGGEGTPMVSEFTAAELGAALATTTRAAWGLIADATDLRHRLPRLWELVTAGRVRVWKVRQVAQATRLLSMSAAARVDAATAGLVTGLPWGRFERVLEAEIVQADPAGAEERARLWEAQRFVRGTRSTAGLRTLVARASAGDVVWFLAMVERIAEILAAEGSLNSADGRRASAIRILAQPAVALELLVRHATTDDHADAAHHDEPVDEHHSLDLDASPLAPLRSPRRNRLATAVRPPVTLYVHLTDRALRSGEGVARIEGKAPVTASQVCAWLGRIDPHLTIRPVLDPADASPADGWEIPHRLREALHLRQPAEVFPWGTLVSRSADLDHTVPYRTMQSGGPPGQTRIDNLGPLSRSHHRAKTFGGWHLRQPEAGHYVWCSPHGRVFHVTNGGTQALGHGSFARAVWDAARAGPPAFGRVAPVDAPGELQVVPR